MPYTAPSGGCKIHYQVEGAENAPALLLLRGLGRSSRYWLGVREPLAERFRLIVPDNRGVGKSDAPRPPYTTAKMARDAVRVLDHAGVPRAHVVGISLGGMIAQRLAIDHPGRVDRLVLGCTSAGGRLGPRVGARAVLALLRAATLPPVRATRWMAPLLLSPAFLERHPDVVDRWAEIARTEPVPRAGFAGQIAAAVLHDASRELDRIRARTLVVTGDADRMIPPDQSRRLHAAIPESRLELLGGVGHDFPTEASIETVRLLVGFLLG